MKPIFGTLSMFLLFSILALNNEDQLRPAALSQMYHENALRCNSITNESNSSACFVEAMSAMSTAHPIPVHSPRAHSKSTAAICLVIKNETIVGTLRNGYIKSVPLPRIAVPVRPLPRVRVIDRVQLATDVCANLAYHPILPCRLP